MVSYGVYRILHLLGIFLVFVAVGGVAVHAGNGGHKSANALRRQLAISHGIGLVLVIVAGFAMLARIGASPASGWVMAKIVIWLLLGAATMLPYKARSLGGAMLALVPLLGAIAAYLAINKPF